MKIEALNRLDPDFLRLSEQEFILSKQRTGTLLGHFPFLKHVHNFKNIVIKDECDKVVGGLIVKINRDDDYLVGSIGLVVVAKEVRGQGHSRLLLQKTIEVCQQEQMDYLLLWTSLHNFYVQFGFEVDEPLTYLEINEQHVLMGLRSETKIDFESQPTYTRSQGLLIYDRTSVSYLHDGVGYIFVDYSGDVTTAADIVTHKFYSANEPRVFIPYNDPLIRELYQRQSDLIQHNYNYEMWLKLETSVRSKRIFNFLQRI